MVLRACYAKSGTDLLYDATAAKTAAPAAVADPVGHPPRDHRPPDLLAVPPLPPSFLLLPSC
eukprot:3687674-Rhodomonas_salina.1